ncbi:MAG TPA: TatD family hydrolase [Tepidisphaeraceae bacterium]|nr:TatD family hydrolase [Tepidisphaeraceae bacterium]
MIDTHCHLTDENLLQQLPDVLARAAEAGVSQMVTVATDIEDSRACVELCRDHANVRCTVGIHPNHAHAATAGDVAKLEIFLTAIGNGVVAMGEMGLDYFHKHTPRAHQHAIFRAQLVMAAERDMPVVIHCREAVDDCLAVMSDFPSIRSVFHCFTGTAEEAKRIVAAGHLIGFTGALTFKKNDALREAARGVPHDRILVETDAPYLTPEPMRKQKINEPALVVHVARTLAQVRGTTVTEIDRLTTANAERFFRWE